MARTRITLVTYNVWFGHYRMAERRRALLSLLHQADADIIGLQEVTPTLLRSLEVEDWIKDEYRLAQVPVAPYGVMLLSRIPVRRFVLHALPSGMSRHLLVAELDDADDMAISTVHLESLHYADKRKLQLETIFPILSEYGHAVLMGDFNMCSSWDENDNLDPAYLDIWPTLRPDEPGYTEDTDINKMRLLVDPTPTQVRFDRVILRSERGAWRPTSIERLGTEPISPQAPEVFASDHFGLRVVIEREPSSEE